ncbi:hypothetical protein E0W68_13130 [Flavobacterium salilacus subsp. salilacus]|uniref:hypothetical protein n=1 Tax=Flavobacterium TaxID=237 RepID=UPI001074D64A|nr:MULTISPECIES: hypothetical protein [Flavobacterium]KAF2515079.1 hypothetical protein E0W68_13130 [Flavobacterium salilacus subsp. salilacus]MBE1615871.1 hypothetical protein [Flavobacterium sp. SaA2.13]
MEKVKVKLETGFLYSKCSFLRGIGSVFNLPGNYYDFDYSDTENEADKKALYSDWENVGADIKTAREKFEKQHKDELCFNK